MAFGGCEQKEKGAKQTRRFSVVVMSHKFLSLVLFLSLFVSFSLCFFLSLFLSVILSIILANLHSSVFDLPSMFPLLPAHSLILSAHAEPQLDHFLLGSFG
jgi:uncharacterized protein YqhQ